MRKHDFQQNLFEGPEIRTVVEVAHLPRQQLVLGGRGKDRGRKIGSLHSAQSGEFCAEDHEWPAASALGMSVLESPVGMAPGLGAKGPS